jgi:guanylate kinase
LAIFVKVPSLEILKSRLYDRNTDSDSSISQRLFKANFEMSFEDQFDVTLVNEDLETSLKEAQNLIDDFLAKD